MKLTKNREQLIDEQIIKDFLDSESITEMRERISKIQKGEKALSVIETDLKEWVKDTEEHIYQVQTLVNAASALLTHRAKDHDVDKLVLAERARDIGYRLEKSDSCLPNIQMIDLWKTFCYQEHKKTGHHTPFVFTDIVETIADWASASYRHDQTEIDTWSRHNKFRRWIFDNIDAIVESMMRLFCEFRDILWSNREEESDNAD